MRSIVSVIKKGVTLKEQVYDYLKEQIILGELKPGERLVEGKVSEALNISRSPIREAIRMLEKDGLLLVNQSGGVNVVKPSIKDFQYLYECRVEMEPVAAYFAAQRRTNEQLETIRTHLLQMEGLPEQKRMKKIHDINVNFHESVVKASANPFLITVINQFRGINSFYRKSILEEKPLHFADAFNEHQRIFQAIVDQDANDAKKLMKEHIENDFIIFMRLSNHGVEGER
ncbi:GntR family transcriptional regulator [Cytobacillus purgationiresistens]|uniref:DNA-binding GntR family transcriptional regulator n=1 Tax=Cytobacillus purgationiresistens TaxID=863449 RepID=A0ABU0AL67_9BACI|nr:GntR family transcriptional regulator [Cytobacillus purgationiresistens]MDQ0272009.1 DNA-binding GntR family transcriptional regulator [Cytobacillus purgationiresistens]